MFATPGACINETGLFSSAAFVPQSKSTAVVPQSKFTEGCSSSAAVVPHKVNLPSCEVTQWTLCDKVSLRRREARRRLFFLTCDIFGTGQTNILALCYLFGKTYKPAHSSATQNHWNQHTRPNYWKSYWREPHRHSTEGFDDSLETCEIERCSVSEPVFKHNSFNCARDVHHKKCGLGFLISAQVKKTSWQ